MKNVIMSIRHKYLIYNKTGGRCAKCGMALSIGDTVIASTHNNVPLCHSCMDVVSEGDKLPYLKEGLLM